MYSRLHLTEKDTRRTLNFIIMLFLGKNRNEYVMNEHVLCVAMQLNLTIIRLIVDTRKQMIMMLKLLISNSIHRNPHSINLSA